MNTIIQINQVIPAELDLQRLDQVLTTLCEHYSRSQIQQWIRSGWVCINGTIEQKPSIKVKVGQKIIIQAKCVPKEFWIPQPLPLNIVYEDEDLIIINKPPGLVVHPGAGNPESTLVNALLHYDPKLAMVPRAGLVHRLDKQTSGLLVVARNLSAHLHLVKNLQERQITREYEAIVQNIMISGGTIETLIGRHPHQRTKMCVLKVGKLAITHYRLIQRYRAHTHIRLRLETGRTHQIRVHLSHIHHPIVGDPEYGKPWTMKSGLSASLHQVLQNFQRQALHAIKLTLTHPRTQEMLSWEIPLPQDMQQLINELQTDLLNQ